jgi:hypothetical protein
MFRSPEQALAFSFRIRESNVISLPSTVYIAQKTEAQSTSSDRLTRYDLHAQAGMVFSFLSRRPELEQAYAFYLYGTPRERKLAANFVARKYRDRFGRYGLDKYRLRLAILARSVRTVAEATGLSEWKSWKLRRDIAGVLEPVRNSLMDALWEWMQDPNTVVEGKESEGKLAAPSQ